MCQIQTHSFNNLTNHTLLSLVIIMEPSGVLVSSTPRNPAAAVSSSILFYLVWRGVREARGPREINVDYIQAQDPHHTIIISNPTC